MNIFSQYLLAFIFLLIALIKEFKTLVQYVKERQQDCWERELGNRKDYMHSTGLCSLNIWNLVEINMALFHVA